MKIKILVGFLMMGLACFSYADEWYLLKPGSKIIKSHIPGSGNFCLRGAGSDSVQVRFWKSDGKTITDTHGVSNHYWGYQDNRKDFSLVDSTGDVFIKRGGDCHLPQYDR